MKDLKFGEITVLLGKNGEGKTTFISQVINHNIRKKEKVYLYSGELSQFKVQDWLYRGLLGSNERFYKIIKGKYEDEWIVKDEIVNAVKKWHNDCFFLFDNQTSLRLKNVDGFFRELVKDVELFKPRLVIIDNLATCIAENSNSIFSDQGNVVQTCKLMAEKYNIHVIVVVHPNKSKEEVNTSIQHPVLTKNDISGSNNIANKADNIVAIERNWYQGEDRVGYDGWLHVLKDRTRGFRKIIPIYFNSKTLRMYDDEKNSEDYEELDFLEFLDFGYEKLDYMKPESLKVKVQKKLNIGELNYEG